MLQFWSFEDIRNSSHIGWKLRVSDRILKGPS